ncbi:MAG: hypothetical protein WCJ74_00195 [bacterium]
MQNKPNIESVLSVSLHDLGFTPRTGSPLHSFIHENDEGFEREAVTPQKCRGASGECGSCGSRPDKCHKVLHSLPKISAGRVLAKWARYYGKHAKDCKCEACHIRLFLMPALKKLVDALMQRGLSPEYLLAEIPDVERILQS